ncbi:sigma-70 family RNA polymerase sigma factor [Chitinolyticbacter meiyuanensis]|uniref:sigma-70 family RNA polymerase sigma factor n=1 Tax=Chitinolyticbacter meiyuanensis TaxID=682798 RepID=UPI0011E607D7|nr:sigma-70 family RNA polymerase sigma factor [Chitinolyticbacter meiyuanensis]
MHNATPSLHTLYQDHHGWLAGWRRKKLGCAHQAADLAQDTFVKLLASRSLPPELREPRAYLNTVASRLLLNHFRRQSLEQAYFAALAQWSEAQAPSPEQRLLVLEALNALEALLDTLPAKVRTAFLLAQLDGLGYAEIAVRLAISERTVKRYMVEAYTQCILLESR